MTRHTLVAGRYRLRAPLGAGGFKTVWRAHDTLLDRDVALARFHAATGDDALRQDLLREARALARLSDHPRIVTVFDAGEDAGAPFLVMRLMAGGDLAALLDAWPGRRLPPARAIAIALDVLDALAAVHAAGVVHRDVKPTNIWLDGEGRAVLGDFGIAARAGGTTDGGAGRSLAGTLPYIAPDQLRSAPSGPRTDLYALGCTLYELLTGAPPFTGEPAAVIARKLTETPAPPSRVVAGLPAALDAAVGALLAADPQDRPADAAAARRLLQRCLPLPGNEDAGPGSVRAREDDAAPSPPEAAAVPTRRLPFSRARTRPAPGPFPARRRASTAGVVLAASALALAGALVLAAMSDTVQTGTGIAGTGFVAVESPAPALTPPAGR